MTQPDWNLLGRHLAGETTTAEAAAARAWLERHPGEAQALALLDTAARNALAAGTLDVSAALDRVKTRADRDTGTKGFRPPARLAGILAAAAVLMLAVALWRAPDDATPRAVVHATERAATDTIRLPDGSALLLGPESRADVAGQNIELTGTARLAIADGAAPYVVRAAGAVIRDIGTTFTVRAYRGEPLAVAVSEGRVVVALAATSVTVDSGEVATVDERGQLVVRPLVGTDDAFGWTEGRLVFRNADMARVVADLRRWYGIELMVTDTTLRDRHFTGAFTTEPPDRVLEIIALTLGARVERRGDTAVVSPIQHE